MQNSRMSDQENEIQHQADARCVSLFHSFISVQSDASPAELCLEPPLPFQMNAVSLDCFSLVQPSQRTLLSVGQREEG